MRDQRCHGRRWVRAAADLRWSDMSFQRPTKLLEDLSRVAPVADCHGIVPGEPELLSKMVNPARFANTAHEINPETLTLFSSGKSGWTHVFSTNQ
ncbi:MAG: hypothetical protein MK179_23120 [Pirellulaceae bacterium]|nr:hypothetical protein [Pirellulaceae bacterium]